MGSELQKAMSEAALGKDLEEALGGVGERMDSPDCLDRISDWYSA